jgi:hypothetical protein
MRLIDSMPATLGYIYESSVSETTRLVRKSYLCTLTVLVSTNILRFTGGCAYDGYKRI